MLSHMMMRCLQPLIPFLVHPEQTGFLRGRCISENFVLATELVQCCHKRKQPAVVLKLDFRKAFYSVSWVALDRVLEEKGFLIRWRTWVRDLNTSSRSAVVLNIVPGRWFECKKGLRQGDSLSPYLFIPFADVLQHLVLAIGAEGGLQHPLDRSNSWDLKLCLRSFV